MLNVLQAALVIIGALLAVPAGVLLAQVILALFRPAASLQGPARRPRIAVIVPAHDEERGIAETLLSIRPQLRTGDRLLVVADNCSDNTAAIAAGLGAEVTERRDAGRRGKGYALDHGMDALRRAHAPEVVIIIDADCRLSEGCLDKLSAACAKTGRPVQAVDLMDPPLRNSSIFTGLITFAWKTKNFIRPLGWHRLGLPCHLRGTGMAFPWPIIAKVDLASGHLVEDVKLGVDLALLGHSPLFCPEACVTSRFPESAGATRSQRTRWEHGYLRAMVQYIPLLLGGVVRQRTPGLLGMLLDLCVPPLALLTLLIAGALGVSLVFFLATGLYAPVLLTATAAVILGVAILLAWARYGREIISLRQLLLAPFYAAAKLPLYANFVLRQQREWVRTKRQ